MTTGNLFLLNSYPFLQRNHWTDNKNLYYIRIAFCGGNGMEIRIQREKKTYKITLREDRSPGSFCLVILLFSICGFYLVAQGGCSSSRPSVSVPVTGQEERYQRRVHSIPLECSPLSWSSCWPGLRHDFIVSHTRKCDTFFLSSHVPC